MKRSRYRGYVIEDHNYTVEILDGDDGELVDGGLDSVKHAKTYIDQLYNPVPLVLSPEGVGGLA